MKHLPSSWLRIRELPIKIFLRKAEAEVLRMSRKFHHRMAELSTSPASILIMFALTAVIGSSQLALAQAPTLQEQLAAQYKLAKMGSDSTGYSIIDEGTLLSVQKGGVLGLPYKSTIWPTATFQNGTVHASAAQTATSGKAADFGKKFCGLTHKCPNKPDSASDETSTQLFKVGDKVYATKINVNVGKDTVTMSIVACDTCNKTDPPTYNKANIAFQFAAGSLANASAGTVEDTIGQLLSISTDDQKSQGDQQQGGDQGAQQQGGGDQQQAAPAEAAAPPAEPPSIEKGMTPDQVEAALGKPDKKVNLGSKQLYIYKDMKVTFVNGKVSDVQ